MNKLIKAMSSLLCALFIVFSLNTVCTGAETYSAEIVVNDAELGSNFEVRIKIGKTKGILNGSFNVVYDNEMVELINAHTDTEMMNGVFFALNDKYTENSVRISFAAAELFGKNGGELMVLNFKAKKVGNAIFFVEKLKLVNQISQYETTDTIKSITINSVSSSTKAKESANTVTTTAFSVTHTTQSAPSQIATSTTVSSSTFTSSQTVSTAMSSSYSSTEAGTITDSKGTTVSSGNAAITTDSQAVSTPDKSNANSTTDTMDIIPIISAVIIALIVSAVLAVTILRKTKQNNK